MTGTGFKDRARTLLNRGVDDHDPEDRENGIHTKETEQSEQAGGGVDVFRVALRRAEQTVNEPRLATDFGSHPACSIRDIRQREAEQEGPKPPASRVEFASPEQECCNDRQSCEVGSEARHDVVGVKEQRQCGGPLVVGKLVQAPYFGSGGAVDKKAQDFIDGDRIINFLRRKIWLSHDNHGSSLLGMKEALHSGDCDGLMSRQVLSMEIAGRKDLRDAGDETSQHTEFEEDSAVFAFTILQHVERADCGHYEGSCDDGSGHIVRILQPCPGIHEEAPEAGDFIGAVGQKAVCHWMLHPRVGDDDEEAGDPGAKKYQKGCSPMRQRREALFSEQEEAEEGRLEKKGKDAFHGKWLANHATGAPGKL